jgi:integrase
MIETRWFFVRFKHDGKTWSRWVPEEQIRLDAGSGQAQDWLLLRGQVKWEGKWLPIEVRRSRIGLSRKLVNQRIDHIKRVFKWALSEEFVPSPAHEALRAVAGLRRGHPGTDERPKVQPVQQGHVDAVLPYLSPQVAAMVQLQSLMGARPTEVCLMRGRNIDCTGPVWWYQIDPNEVSGEALSNLHKTAHQEHGEGTAPVKLLPIGPKAQAILKEWLRESPDEFLFQPREARLAKYAKRRRERKTSLWPSHLIRWSAPPFLVHPKWEYHTFAI